MKFDWGKFLGVMGGGLLIVIAIGALALLAWLVEYIAALLGLVYAILLVFFVCVFVIALMEAVQL